VLRAASAGEQHRRATPILAAVEAQAPHAAPFRSRLGALEAKLGAVAGGARSPIRDRALAHAQAAFASIQVALAPARSLRAHANLSARAAVSLLR
jgi:hypothetical protein